MHVQSLFTTLGAIVVLLAATALGLWRVMVERAKKSDEERLGQADIKAVRKAAEAGDDAGVLAEWRKHRK